MSEILEKLGIYDLIAVLLSGISVSTISILTLQFVYHISIDTNFAINETLLFFVISYFVGLVLQETGWLVHKKILYKNSKLLTDALASHSNLTSFMTDFEKDEIFQYVKEHLGNQNLNDSVVYNYCKFHVVNHCDMSRIDKDQSLSAMSRSLYLYFFVLSVCSALSILWQFSYLRVGLTVISLALTLLFHNRCVRFAKLRYSNIFRMFYHSEQDSFRKWRESKKSSGLVQIDENISA